MLASVFAHEVYVTSYRSATRYQRAYRIFTIRNFYSSKDSALLRLRALGRVLNPRTIGFLMSIDFKNIPPLDTKRKTNASQVIKKFDRAAALITRARGDRVGRNENN